MKLIPKYHNGNKTRTYQYRKFGDVSLPTNTKILDESGLEIHPDENTKILTDEDGNPINRDFLVANGYYYQTPSGDIVNNTPLDEAVVTAKRPVLKKAAESAAKFINDEIFLNKDNIRVNNYRRALQHNPNFSQDWDMLNNIYDYTNIASAGLINRFSPTQNIGFVIDAAQGDNLLNSWMGNSGIVSDKFIQEHPWWSLAINGVGDILPLRYGKAIVTGTRNATKNFRPYVEAYNHRKDPFIPNYKFIDHFYNTLTKEKNLDYAYNNSTGIDKYDLNTPIYIMGKDEAQFAVRNNPGKVIGAEIHLGGVDGLKPSTKGQRFAFRMFDNLPSGSYISSNSYQPSLTGVVQDRGFWKTIFSKDYNPFIGPELVSANRIPLTENSYETLLNVAKRNSEKFRLDFAHNYRGNLHLDPESVDKSKQFYQLYHEALDTKDLTNLNEYLRKMNAPKATFDNVGNIELSMPLLYKRRFGGKLK